MKKSKPILTLAQVRASKIPQMKTAAAPIHNYLRDGCWKGQRCFIVGGGKSLKGFDFSLIQDELTIGVNRAFESFDPSIIFSMDCRFLKWVEDSTLGDKARDKFINYERGLKVWLDVVEFGFTEDIIPVRCCGLNEWGHSLKDGLGHGENSGFAALNLAFILGANPIYLLGFDMQGDSATGMQQWFHSGYPEIQPNSVYEKFKRYFNDIAAPAIETSGVSVINLNPNSGLNCFPKCTIQGIEFQSMPVFVSFHTPGYEKHAARLEESSKVYGLQREYRKIEDQGGWQLNCKYKPIFLLEMLEKYGKPVVWIDSDAEFEQYPGLFDKIKFADIGYHLREKTGEVLGGTLYFGNTDNAKMILREWIKQNNESPTDSLDQTNLQTVLKRMEGSFKEAVIPASYCCIFDAIDMLEKEPVIVHNQASREIYWNHQG